MSDPRSLSPGASKRSCPFDDHYERQSFLAAVVGEEERRNSKPASPKIPVSGPWSAEEDKELLTFVEKFGARHWRRVSKLTRLKRDPQSCRTRWLTVLSKEASKLPFSAEEDRLLLRLVSWSGETKWATIASQHFPMRNGFQIQQRWHFLVRQQQAQVQQSHSQQARELTRSSSSPGNVGRSGGGLALHLNFLQDEPGEVTKLRAIKRRLSDSAAEHETSPTSGDAATLGPAASTLPARAEPRFLDQELGINAKGAAPNWATVALARLVSTLGSDQQTTMQDANLRAIMGLLPQHGSTQTTQGSEFQCYSPSEGQGLKMNAMTHHRTTKFGSPEQAVEQILPQSLCETSQGPPGNPRTLSEGHWINYLSAATRLQTDTLQDGGKQEVDAMDLDLKLGLP